jgi:hypothetical protein
MTNKIIKKISLAFCILISPALISLPTAFAAYVSYKYFNVDIEVKPWLLNNAIFVNGLICSIVCLVLLFFLVGKRWIPTIVAGLPLAYWAIVKSYFFHDEVVAFLGYSCCRDVQASIFSLIEMGISPIAPYYMLSYLFH